MEKYTHWVLDDDNKIVGLAGDVEHGEDGISSAFVCLFGLYEFAEYGTIETNRLLKLTVPIEVGNEKAVAEAVV